MSARGEREDNLLPVDLHDEDDMERGGQSGPDENTPLFGGSSSQHSSDEINDDQSYICHCFNRQSGCGRSLVVTGKVLKAIYYVINLGYAGDVSLVFASLSAERANGTGAVVLDSTASFLLNFPFAFLFSKKFVDYLFRTGRTFSCKEDADITDFVSLILGGVLGTGNMLSSITVSGEAVDKSHFSFVKGQGWLGKATMIYNFGSTRIVYTQAPVHNYMRSAWGWCHLDWFRHFKDFYQRARFANLAPYFTNAQLPDPDDAQYNTGKFFDADQYMRDFNGRLAGRGLQNTFSKPRYVIEACAETSIALGINFVNLPTIFMWSQTTEAGLDQLGITGMANTVCTGMFQWASFLLYSFSGVRFAGTMKDFLTRASKKHFAHKGFHAQEHSGRYYGIAALVGMLEVLIVGLGHVSGEGMRNTMIDAKEANFGNFAQQYLNWLYLLIKNVLPESSWPLWTQIMAGDVVNGRGTTDGIKELVDVVIKVMQKFRGADASTPLALDMFGPASERETKALAKMDTRINKRRFSENTDAPGCALFSFCGSSSESYLPLEGSAPASCWSKCFNPSNGGNA